MNLDWQLITVLVAITLAGGYLARRLWKIISQKNTSACGGCSKCVEKTPENLPLVSSDSLKESAQQK